MAANMMDPTADVIVVRLPIAQACRGVKWRASCGRSVDYGNKFVHMLSSETDRKLRQIHAEGSGTQRPRTSSLLS